MRRRLAAVLVLLVAALLAAGCGGDDNTTPAASGTRTDGGGTSVSADASGSADAGGSSGTSDGTGTTQHPATQTATTPLDRQRAADIEAVRRNAHPARACLERAGYRVAGGSPRLDDENAPDYEYVLRTDADGGAGAFIALYAELARAKRFEPGIRRNAKQFRESEVERSGAVTIVWVRLADERARARIKACLVD